MSSNPNNKGPFQKKPVFLICLALVVIGFAAFVFGLTGRHPVRAWQAYLINFLVWSAIAQGGFLFSVVMHTTKARWSGPLSNLAESRLFPGFLRSFFDSFFRQKSYLFLA